MRRLILTGSLLALFSSQVMSGQIYQWTDASGQTHYSSQPPQGVQSTLVSTGSSKPKAPVAAVPTPVAQPSDTENPQKDIDAKVKQEVAKQQAELKKYCETLRTNLSQLENNPRISIEENGETRRLTEKERQAQMADAQKSIKENCN
ncbi:MAG TPA: DUF4124 domain-containing protein [Pseudomonas sp.]|nr:DUF4124 domain-containing protein [Pseudomonas sp.]